MTTSDHTPHHPHGANDRGPYIGRAIDRIEDERFLRGEGCYVDDINLPGMLHAAILRSSVAHGIVRTIDAAGALALKCVHAVIDAALIARTLNRAVPPIPLRQEPLPELARFHQPVIAEQKVRYVGEPLAMVVADSPAAAEDALEQIELTIDPLLPIIDCKSALAAPALLFENEATNHAFSLSAVKGDCAAAFAAAPYRRRERFDVHRHTAVPIETRGLVADWNSERGMLVVYGVAKVPFVTRRMLAERLAMPIDSIDMIECDVGGAFGVRGEFYPEDFLIPFAARLLRKPVKWIEDRREHLLATNHARETECDIEIACDHAGHILGLRGHAHVDAGAYLRNAGVTPARNIVQVAPGPYHIPNVDMTVSLLLTNKTPVGTYRGPGRFEIDFFRERLIDMAAADLGIDRVAMRRRNLVAPEQIPYALPTVHPYNISSTTDSGNYAVTLARCLQEIDWQGLEKLNGQSIDGRYHGLALGCYIEGGASGPGESARLVLDADSSITVHVGSSAVGQGLETAHAQIAADALGVELSAIRAVRHGSTNTVKQGYGSYSSRSTVMGGSAILDAAERLTEDIRQAAARRFDCAPSEVELIGMREARGPRGKSASIAELAATPFVAEGSFESAERTYSYGTHAAHITVDPATGKVTVLDYVAVEDVGRIVNPHTLHGQSVGAIVQGLGGVLLEALYYDDEAQLLTGSLADYMLPTSTEFANIRIIALEQYPSPNNPLGAKGAGEGGIIPVGGLIANAVAAALRDFHAEPRALPLTPPRVWRLIQDASAPSTIHATDKT